jgi:hypothetical protein
MENLFLKQNNPVTYLPCGWHAMCKTHLYMRRHVADARN